MDSRKVQRRLRETREERGRTQQSLAEQLGVTAPAVSHWENSHNNGRARDPSAANLVKLADALDVSTDYLLCRTDDPAPGRLHALVRRYEALSREDQQLIGLLLDRLEAQG